MIVVNLFGAPSSGKSTCASLVFTRLKMARINVELVTEYAKEMTWERNELALSNQAYVFGQQYYRLSRLQNKVDVVITDSPLPLSILYNRDPVLGQTFNAVVMNVFNSFQNINYFLTRAVPYDPNGRWQTEEDANNLSRVLQGILVSNRIAYTEYPGMQENYEKVADEILGICGTLGLSSGHMAAQGLSQSKA